MQTFNWMYAFDIHHGHCMVRYLDEMLELIIPFGTYIPQPFCNLPT